MELDPIFVDGSGRRRMALRWSGIAVTGMLATCLVVVGIALISKVTVPQAELPHKTNTHAPAHDDSRDGTHTPHRRNAQ
jgi:hypothetical protein